MRRLVTLLTRLSLLSVLVLAGFDSAVGGRRVAVLEDDSTGLGSRLISSRVGGELGEVGQFHVLQLVLSGSDAGPTDAPAKDVELKVTFEHESGDATISVAGFWDGDGRGGSRGGVFKVRFCPTIPGRWQVVRTESNDAKLRGQLEGNSFVATASSHPGFWLPDGRWYRRSDGSHPFIVGNTHYSFLSRCNDRGPVATDPVDDVRAGANYFKKTRFSLTGDRYPHPTQKPFLDDQGRPSDDGRFSFRPNPSWFLRRVDPVIAEAHAQDMICDLILCGPDTRESRSTLQDDPEPWLRYVAARYGAYPNVWFCMANEWNIKDPKYRAEGIARAGNTLRRYLPYPTPVSVHRAPMDWDPALNGPWHDHVIIQAKIRELPKAADTAARNYHIGGRKPVVNDENAYQGDGDRFSHGDTVEGCFGTFLGGGYPTTGEKYGRKLGQYFWGRFDPKAHSAAENLGYLRSYVDESVAFWGLAPTPPDGIFTGLPSGARLLAEPGREYVLGSNRKAEGARVKLPEGVWTVVQCDLMNMSTKTLSGGASGTFEFDLPDSRAVLTHFKRTRPR